MSMHKDLSMSLSDNGGYILTYTKMEKPEGSGEFSNMIGNYKKETFGPSEEDKAFARFREIKKECFKKEEDED